MKREGTTEDTETTELGIWERRSQRATDHLLLAVSDSLLDPEVPLQNAGCGSG